MPPVRTHGEHLRLTPRRSAGCHLPARAITGAIGALKGPLHGGANEGVIKNLLDIGEPGNIKSWLDDKFSEKGFRLMGFGHRVYKVLDPRARIEIRERTG